MSKAYEGKTCVYCFAPNSEGADHIIPRQFFLEDQRSNLPKVPACRQCNNEKSELEHYLASVIPFGSAHATASETLAMVERRLEKNRPFTVRSPRGCPTYIRRRTDGPWTINTMTVPLDGRRLLKWFEFVVKGLAWHHWSFRSYQASTDRERAAELLLLAAAWNSSNPGGLKIVKQAAPGRPRRLELDSSWR